MILDAEDVEFFEIAEFTTATGPAVYIDGLVFHSAYAVDHIEQSNKQQRRSGCIYGTRERGPGLPL